MARTEPGSRVVSSIKVVLAALPVLLILIGLGTWQLDRLAWKQDLIARIDAGLAADPVELPALVDRVADWDYVRLRVTGTFLHDRETYIGPRLYPGPDGRMRAGVHVLTPLVRADGGGMVLVDRGWVPLDRRDPASRAEGQVTGLVTVTGIGREPHPRGFMQPDNRPATREFFWLDMPALATLAGAVTLAPLILQVDGTANPGGLPIGGRTLVTLKSDHLSYALTWYGLALTLIGVLVAAGLRRRKAPVDAEA